MKLKLQICLLLLSISYLNTINSSTQTNYQVEYYLTTPNQSSLFEQQASPQLLDELSLTNETLQIYVLPNITYQTMEGFGAALTDSSAWILGSQLDDEERHQWLKNLYSKEEGIGLGVLRLPLGASDFAFHQYTYDDMPDGQIDANLSHFSINHDYAYIIPVLKEILSINPNLWIVSAPWSPPAWMKNSTSLDTGEILEEYYQQFADYYVKFLQDYKNEGINVNAISLQNEPHHQDCNYPCTWMTPDAQATIIKEYLYPALEANNLTDVKILIWDHNWNRPDFPLTILEDPEANKLVAGVAWHGYEGQVSAQTQVHNQYPDKETYLTEQSGGTWFGGFADELSWFAQNIIIGSPKNYAKGVLLWNLVLDQFNGPTDGGCVDTCEGVLNISLANSTHQTIEKTCSYYLLAHASKFIQKGAIRIESNDTLINNQITSVAFINQDDSVIVLVYNSDVSDHSLVVSTLNLNQQYMSFNASIPSGSLATFRLISNQSDNDQIVSTNT